MALDTYAGLKASMADWLIKSNLTAVIPDFITLCEAEMNNILSIRKMETSLILTIATQAQALPNDYQGIRNIYITSSPTDSLRYLAPEQARVQFAVVSTGQPTHYTIEQGNIVFFPAPDATYSAIMNYLAKIPSLSDTNQTNFILGDAPGAYLYGSLRHAAPYLGQDTRIPVWEAMFNKIIYDINANDLQQKYSGSALQMHSDYGQF